MKTPPNKVFYYEFTCKKLTIKNIGDKTAKSAEASPTRQQYQYHKLQIHCIKKENIDFDEQ